MMKKTITIITLLLNVCFCVEPVSAQCPGSGSASGASPGGFTETLNGQEIRNTCAYTMTGLTVQLASSYTTSGTMTLSVYSGNNSCNAGSTLLKSGTATPGKSGSFTISLASSQTLAANTTYYVEITGTVDADVQKLISTFNNNYTAGRFYYRTIPGSTCVVRSTDDLTFTLVGAVLPIELVSFDVQNTEGGKNHLTWRTESEKNNSHFDIERSTDGNSFHNIGQVKGNNKPSSYTYADAAPFSTSYYRLKQVDFDGTETYSKVVSVALKGKGKGLTIYPTLVSNVLTVDYTEGGQLRDFSVTNLLGQQVLVGKTTTQIDVSALAKGTYMLKVGSEVAKFVKQ